MSDRDEREPEEEAEDEEELGVKEFPVKGPATGQQAILAIGFVFFLGLVTGYLLCLTF